MKTDYEYLPLSKIKVDIRNQLCYSQNYAHAVHEKRAIDAASVNTPDGTTVLLSIRLKGSLIYIYYASRRKNCTVISRIYGKTIDAES